MKVIYTASIAATLVLLVASATATAIAEEAAAHNPQYDNKDLWPHDVAKTDYFKQQWPPAPLLVWAKTGSGVDAARLRIRADLRDPANWRIAGKPAKRIPDHTTDVLFPAGNYDVKFMGEGTFKTRHLTVGSGVRVSFPKADIEGNLWIKKGGTFSRAHGKFSGWQMSNFCRCDNEEPQFIANFFTHNKQPGTSTEWIGKWQVGDEVNIISGGFIVGPGSTFMPTDRRTQRIQGDAELILMSGSTYHLRGNYAKGIDIQIDGKLLAGTPERPLTKDCTLGLSYKAPKSNSGLDIGLVVTEDASMMVHSAAPEQARLVIRQHNMPQGGSSRKTDTVEQPINGQGTTMLLMGDLRFDGVMFNDVRKGGIMMPDPSIRTRWRHVFYGPDNFGSPDELYRTWDEAGPKVNTRPGRSAD